MSTVVQILLPGDSEQIHERSIRLLERTGLQVLSERARKLLSAAGAELESGGERVRFPRAVIEHALKLAPKDFALGSRHHRPDLEMNAGRCWLCADGGAISVIDWNTRELRAGTRADWLAATRLIEGTDEINLYWNPIEGSFSDTAAGFVEYWTELLSNCTKHIQDSVNTVEKARLLLEILEIAFGDRDVVRAKHPISYVVCPMSPLVIDRAYTDAFLETAGWEIPAAIMPMPLMGATAPASLISTLMIANAEFLAMLCLVQAAAQGTPVIYAVMPSAVEPRTWRYSGGGIENPLLSAGAVEMGRFYGLPVESGAGGTDHCIPGIQAAYERGLSWVLPALARPDILVGPGLLGGSTILSLEQMMMDVEIFRRCARLSAGFSTQDQQRFDDLIESQGPGGSFVGQKATLQALHNGSFYIGNLGYRGTYEHWTAAGAPDIGDELYAQIGETLASHEPPRLDAHIERALRGLAQRVAKASA